MNTKIHLAVDANGMPVQFFVAVGNRADCKEAVRLIERITDEVLLADRGYDTNEIIAFALQAGMEFVITPKKNERTGMITTSISFGYIIDLPPNPCTSVGVS